MLRFMTAGESHGKMLAAIIDGLPQGIILDKKLIDKDLKLRQQGYGRGARMKKIEKDKVEIVSGVRKKGKKLRSLGSPVCLLINNKDKSIDKLPKVIFPRPGHADLAGLLKYGSSDARDILERASARETASRVAIGSICKMLLSEFSIKISSKVISVAGLSQNARIKKVVDEAKKDGETLGGIIEVRAKNMMPGLGTYAQYDRRLDAALAAALMSIPAVKGVEIGIGFGNARHLGSNVHDAIYFSKAKGYFRKTNNAGGLEGGISNGEDLVLRCAMKPIATLKKALDSVNINTKKAHKAACERSDVCAVESLTVIAEAMMAFEIAKALLDKFGSDSLDDIKTSVNLYKKRLKR